MDSRKVVTLAADTRGQNAYDSAASAFLAAEFDVCAAYLAFDEPRSVAESGRADLLRAQLARSRGDSRTQVDSALPAMRNHPASEGRLLATALAAAGSRALGDATEAEALFERVRAAVSHDVRPATALAAYLLGIDAWARRDYDAAELAIAPYLALPEQGVHALTLRGWIAFNRRQFHRAGVDFVAALTRHETGEDHGVFARGTLVSALTIVAVETASLELARRARASYARLRWSETLRSMRFYILMNFYQLSLLEGDLDGAWLETREMTQLASTPATRALAETCAGRMSRLIGDVRGARIQFERAYDIIRAERWGDASEQDRVALCAFAVDAAREMPAEARHAVTLHQSLRAKRTPLVSFNDDGRVDAFTAFALGRLEDATGARAAAVERYRAALAAYETLGLDLRIATVAADLFRLTRDLRYRERMERALARTPNAWLLKRRSPGDELGPKARDVLARLLSGDSTKTIAAALGRSDYTVTNHTRRIFAAFEVRSRDALRARCAELGITPTTLRSP